MIIATLASVRKDSKQSFDVSKSSASDNGFQHCFFSNVLSLLQAILPSLVSAMVLRDRMFMTQKQQ